MKQQPDMVRMLAAEAIRLKEIVLAMDRLADQIRQARQNAQVTLDQLNQRIAVLMQEAGKRHVQVQGWNISLHEEESVVIDDPDLIPDECVYVETEVSRNALWGKIRRRIRNGERVPGARLVREPETVTMTRRKGAGR